MPTGSVARGSSKLWKNRDFVVFFAGQSVSQCGSAMTLLALPLVAVTALKAPTFEVGLLSSAGTLAFLVGALPVGVAVERSRKRRTMVLSDVLRTLILGTVPLAAVLREITVVQLAIVALTTGLLAVFFDIAYQTYVPRLLSANELPRGNAVLSTSGAISQVAGPSLGAVLVGAIGGARTMGIDAATFALSALSLALIRKPDARTAALPGPGEDEPSPGLRRQIAEGLSFLSRHPILSRLTAYVAIINLLMTMATSVEMIYLIRVLHVRTSYTGALVSIAECGGIIGGLAAGTLICRVGTARILWLAPVVLCSLGFLVPFAQPGWGALLYAVGWSGFSANAVVFTIASQTYRQRECPPRLLGRVTASARWLTYGLMPFGGILGGALGTAFGVRAALAIAVSAVWLSGLLVLASPLRTMRDFPVLEPESTGQVATET